MPGELVDGDPVPPLPAADDLDMIDGDEARPAETPEAEGPMELGAAFASSDVAAAVFTGQAEDPVRQARLDAARRAQMLQPDVGAGPLVPQELRPPSFTREALQQQPRQDMRHLEVPRSGDDEVDAMLMLRAVFDSVPSAGARRRLAGWAADRYL